jgi:predicted dehydrogenase
VSGVERDGVMRAAVIGPGSIGAVHSRALAANRTVELVAVCGRTAHKAEALAAGYGARAYTSVGELLERERPEIVCVCTGNTEHVEPTMDCLRAGAHVFVEKPMAFRLDEARTMADLARERGVALGVNFNHRFSEPYRRARAFVDAGGVGRPAYLAMKMAGDLYKDLDGPFSMLIETQGHCFDMLRFFGGEIEEVSALLTDPREIGVYTSAAIGVRFASGAIGTILGSWDSSYDHPQAQTFELCGVDGRAVVENVVDSVRLYRHGEPSYTEWRPGLFDADRRDFWRTIDEHLTAFVAAVGRGDPPPVSGEDGVRALALTFAAIRSFKERRPVPV